MLLRATRTNPNEVRFVNGKAVVVDAKKPRPAPRPSQPTGPVQPKSSVPEKPPAPAQAPKADVPPPPDSSTFKPPGDATKHAPDAKSKTPDRKTARNDERRNIAQIIQAYDWHKQFILNVLVLQSNHTTSLLAALLSKYELSTQDDEFELPPMSYHGSIIPFKVITFHKLAVAIFCDQQFHMFLVQHINANNDQMKEIDPEVFERCSRLSLTELEKLRVLEKDNLEGFFDKTKADLVRKGLSNEEGEELLQRRKKVLLIDWFVARPRPGPTRGTALPHPAPDLPGMAERVRELQQTPVLYKAWLEETRLETACTGTITR